MTDTALLFIALIAFSLITGLIDFLLWMQGSRTISQIVWGCNQWTLALAFASGVIAGHLFTVPF